MSDVIVIGGGAAGMTAAIFAAEHSRVTLIEKNDRLGRKLAITGKGRCNLTNNCDVDEVMKNIPRNPRFLYSAMNNFPPSEVMSFFEGLGVELKTERGRRVFPVSDKAGDIVSALERELKRRNVEIVRENVRSLIIENGKCTGVNTAKKQFKADAVVLATGGRSYPKTGSDGFGYEIAKKAGHTVIPPKPSLSALVTEEQWVKKAAGLTLKNCSMRLLNGEKTIYEDFGELGFTEDGIGGATVLSASAHIPDGEENNCSVMIDLKPALPEKQLDQRILRDFSELHGKAFSDCLRKLLPKELIEPLAEITGVEQSKKISEITKEERKNLVKSLKALRLKISGFRPIDEAVITRGGVCTKEIDPKTMESRIVKGLFFAGEIIDVDAYTGGFNLQIAFATGRLAGENSEKII
ncbi:MAG: NAD(P)/FAD-dependent oxidoreductase [Oscillospiraceae bacterium]|nr:NAD(P)/FAD-dependent oxidoreductase [Oscillospiraceae bacterium]